MLDVFRLRRPPVFTLATREREACSNKMTTLAVFVLNPFDLTDMAQNGLSFPVSPRLKLLMCR